MNLTGDNTTFFSCGVKFLPIIPAQIFLDLRAVFVVRIVVNALICPLIILLNILVMVAVKTKRQLRTKSNIALACLATTDLVVGVVVQPLQISRFVFLLHGETEVFCGLKSIISGMTVKCVLASLYHLLLMSAERYVAVKHPFTHENDVTEVRVIIASGLGWAALIILPLEALFSTKRQLLVTIRRSVILFHFSFAMIYFYVAIYKEARRNDKQIAANQVSQEAKEKILKNKKAFYTTIIVLFVIFLCHLPTSLCLIILFAFRDRISANLGHIVIYLVSLLPVVNSLFNPLIYAVRMRYFRVAFIQLLSGKTVAQAEELERKIFGPRQIGVITSVEEGQYRANQEEDPGAARK